MDILNTSLLSVRWDLRAIWQILTFVAQIYLTGLFGTIIFTIGTSARTLWLLRQLADRTGQESTAAFQELAWRIHSLRQFLTLAFLVFGVVLANEVFASLRTVRPSYMSLSEYRLSDALEAPTAFAFVSLSTFFCLHVLQWYADARIQRKLRR